MTFKEAIKASVTGYVQRFDKERGAHIFRTARREYVSDDGVLRPSAGSVTNEKDWEPVQPAGTPGGGIPDSAPAVSVGAPPRRDRHMWTNYPAMLKKQNEKIARERAESGEDQGNPPPQV